MQTKESQKFKWRIWANVEEESSISETELDCKDKDEDKQIPAQESGAEPPAIDEKYGYPAFDMEVVDYIRAHFGIAVISEVDAEYQTKDLPANLKYKPRFTQAILMPLIAKPFCQDQNMYWDGLFGKQWIVPLYKLQIPSVLQDVNKWLKSIEIAVKFHSIRKTAVPDPA
ncbi:hypothetical protein HDU77_009485 [Chytriomyces hyalinus]|nr:hypothetical protein HDU77_009485 [Chytriomyces hyalinus]